MAEPNNCWAEVGIQTENQYDKCPEIGGRHDPNGFFILLPFLLTYLMLGQLFDGLMALTQPIEDVMPASLFARVWVHRLVVVGLLIVIFILLALAAKTVPARRLGSWIESTVRNRFPPYRVLKNLSQWIAGKDVPDELQPALLTASPGIRMVVAIVEELPDGHFTVFVPLAPTPGVGFLQIVDSTKVEKLDVSMTDALGWFLDWGLEGEVLLRSRRAVARGSSPA